MEPGALSNLPYEEIRIETPRGVLIAAVTGSKLVRVRCDDYQYADSENPAYAWRCSFTLFKSLLRENTREYHTVTLNRQGTVSAIWSGYGGSFVYTVEPKMPGFRTKAFQRFTAAESLYRDTLDSDIEFAANTLAMDHADLFTAAVRLQLNARYDDLQHKIHELQQEQEKISERIAQLSTITSELRAHAQ